MIALVMAMSLFACKEEPVKKTKPKSVPVTVELGKPPTPVEQIVELSEMLGLFQELKVSSEYQNKMAGVVNLLRSACPDSWVQEKSLIQSVLGNTSCDQDKILLKQALQLLEMGVEVDKIISSLALPGPHFQERDHNETLELWLDSESNILGNVIERIIELQDVQIIFRFYGKETVVAEQFNELGNVKFNEKIGQKLTLWLDGERKIEHLIAILKPNSEPIKSASSVSKNNEKVTTFGVRSSPTWFVKGYRLRGLQSAKQIRRIQAYP